MKNRPLLLFGVFTCLTFSTVFGQWQGEIGLFAEPYFTAARDTTIQARRPGFLAGIYLTGNYEISDEWQIPTRLRLSLPRTSIFLPEGESVDFWSFLTGGQQQIYLNPRFRDFSFELGSHTPYYSELTAGNLQLFGLGAAYNGDRFGVSLNQGLSQRFAFPNALAFGAESDRPKVSGGQFRYSIPDRLHLRLNMLRLQESGPEPDVDSPGALRSGSTVSLSGTYSPKGNWELNWELANSAIPVSDSGVIAPEQSPAAWLLAQDSLLSGLATDLNLRYGRTPWGFTLSGRWMSRYFRQVDFPENPGDQLEISLKPYANLFNHKLVLRAQVGWRAYDFSRRDEGLANRRLIGMCMLLVRPANWFNLNVQYANFGVRNRASEDTLAVQYISNRLSLQPAFTWKGFGKKQTTSLTFSSDRFAETTNFRPDPVENHNLNLALVHSVRLTEVLQAGAMYSFYQNTVFDTQSRFQTISANGGLRIPGGLSLTGSVRYTLQQTTGTAGGNRTGGRISLRCPFLRDGQLKFSYSLNHIRYGTAGQPQFAEHFFQTSLSYKL